MAIARIRFDQANRVGGYCVVWKISSNLYVYLECIFRASIIYDVYQFWGYAKSLLGFSWRSPLKNVVKTLVA